MDISDVVLNATAAWVILKAVEVLPFAAYDFYAFIKERFAPMEGKLSQRFDKVRGKLEFVFSGAGFFQLSLCRRSKRLFLIAILVPVTVFVFEIFSIFLGNETRVCLTSRDPNVVKAPALRLFGEGERELNAIELNNEIFKSGIPFRPCLRREWTYSGVEFVASMCADLIRIAEIRLFTMDRFAENERISIALVDHPDSSLDYIMLVNSLPFKDDLRNLTVLGSLPIHSDVFVNGKNAVVNDAVNGFSLDETTIAEIDNDVKTFENITNSAPSEFYEIPGGFMLAWANFDDFQNASKYLVYSVISQSRSVGLRTAAEMSHLNVGRELKDIDISCQEDYFLARKVSIIIIITGAVLRLFLGALPKSASSAEYALQACENGEEYHGSTESNAEQQLQQGEMRRRIAW